MTPDPAFCSETVSAAEAAKQMADQDVGAIPVCSTEGRLTGVVTDRDLAVHVVAQGLDPRSTTIGDIVGRSEVVTIGADDSLEETIRTMKDHAVRRLPVIDGDRVVGMVSQADVARAMPNAKIGDLVGAISAAPSNG
jgi:CBS domain-containing protein